MLCALYSPFLPEKSFIAQNHITLMSAACLDLCYLPNRNYPTLHFTALNSRIMR